MKRLILLLSLAGLMLNANAQTTVSTNITGGAAVYLVSTNRVNAYAFEVAATNQVTVTFYDNDDNSSVPSAASTPGYFGTNIVTAAYISKVQYLTNIATSYINTSGYTNWYTNSMLWTVTSTNAAATNSLPVALSIPVSANETRVVTAPVNFVRGVLARVTGNASITIYAR
jgi:hypothetical protein